MSATSASADSPSSGRRIVTPATKTCRRGPRDFDFETALIADYSRHGEKRRIAVGYLHKRLHLLCYLPLPDGIRVIGFRKTNKREAKLYGKPQTID
jgi:uncharacterized protein